MELQDQQLKFASVTKTIDFPSHRKTNILKMAFAIRFRATSWSVAGCKKASCKHGVLSARQPAGKSIYESTTVYKSWLPFADTSGERIGSTTGFFFTGHIAFVTMASCSELCGTAWKCVSLVRHCLFLKDNTL